MTDQEKKYWHQINTDDYNTMRAMLNEIEMLLIGVDPVKQRQFYQPILYMISEAVQDARNPKDSFLFSETA